MITFTQKGDWKDTKSFLNRAKEGIAYRKFQMIGEAGVHALEDATPKDSGKTANSWYYEINMSEGSISINFKNSNLAEGWFPVALMLQYGHGTRNGGWVEGRDYINPALRPIFDKLCEEAWKEIVK